ncbi:hypothetical protein V6U78_07390 [Marinospirillum sp. MEB164]|uniref:Uncharacterized protein n=1 Tax=Marinospirillum alkalitolerans TaxID=3123374 RepID=A0ABW8PYD9_9GAMM
MIKNRMKSDALFLQAHLSAVVFYSVFQDDLHSGHLHLSFRPLADDAHIQVHPKYVLDSETQKLTITLFDMDFYSVDHFAFYLCAKYKINFVLAGGIIQDLMIHHPPYKNHPFVGVSDSLDVPGQKNTILYFDSATQRSMISHFTQQQCALVQSQAKDLFLAPDVIKSLEDRLDYLGRVANLNYHTYRSATCDF